MFNSTKLYARSFKPVEGGYLYYPHRWSQGFLISPDEYDQLIENWRRITSLRGQFKLIAFVMIVAIIQVALESALGFSDAVSSWMTIAIAFAVVAYILWKSTAAYRLVRQRAPIAPRRNRREAEADMAERFSWPFLLFALVLSLWFTFLFFLVALANPLIGLPLLILFGASAFMNARVAFRKWSTERSEA
ncbi:hypothetical protein [Altererythrobacter sp. Root672]|uniref:hypothetical protein n=1 Tax=Altererythrobacter sp. Root672 TaxID=1736584 RepID=UPI0006FE7364|nr:hypothetical protein [Altererythrobacter sp. Root672]KRA79761.1 hypothetical protein ASD76_17240 [Altererythrobacter sp. Root672]